jgi:hypothetical protein
MARVLFWVLQSWFSLKQLDPCIFFEFLQSVVFSKQLNNGRVL